MAPSDDEEQSGSTHPRLGNAGLSPAKPSRLLPSLLSFLLVVSLSGVIAIMNCVIVLYLFNTLWGAQGKMGTGVYLPLWIGTTLAGMLPPPLTHLLVRQTRWKWKSLPVSGALIGGCLGAASGDVLGFVGGFSIFVIQDLANRPHTVDGGIGVASAFTVAPISGLTGLLAGWLIGFWAKHQQAARNRDSR